MERVIVLHLVLAGKHNQDGRADSVPRKRDSNGDLRGMRYAITLSCHSDRVPPCDTDQVASRFDVAEGEKHCSSAVGLFEN